MNKKLTIIFIAASLVLALAGTAFASPQDPFITPDAQQGVLLIKAHDNEITIAKDGAGYNLHRFASLRLVVEAGQNDFDYFCGNTKYFVGNMLVKAGQTTTVTLQPGKCEEPTITTTTTNKSDVLSPADYQIMWSIGNADGWSCADHAYPPSWTAAQQSAYSDGYANGIAGYNAQPGQFCAKS